MPKENWFNKLFIDEAKPALNRHSGSGGGTVRSIKMYLEAGGKFNITDIEDYGSILEYGDTENITNMYGFFSTNKKLKRFPSLDTKNVTNINYLCNKNESMEYVPELDTSKVVIAQYTFNECSSLKIVSALDLRNVYSLIAFLGSCYALEEVWVRNIYADLQVGSGATWGHLLTQESLIHLISELILPPNNQTKVLTIGSANLEKLTNVYVRLVEVTDEMRAKDDLIDGKLPFEICGATDEGAIPIIDYANSKRWNIA